MSGLNYRHLRKPAKRWSPSKARHTPDFETVEFARARRTLIRKSLGKMAHTFAQAGDADLARQLRRLKRKLGSRRHKLGRSLADPVEVRRVRNIIAAHMWRFLVRNRLRLTARFITIIPRAWQYNLDTLPHCDPTRLLNALRSQFIRLGAKGADGFLFVSIDIAYDLRHHVYQLHVHGMASGGMLAAVRKLKGVPRFKSERCRDVTARDLVSREDVRVADPVRISKGPMDRLPRPLLYQIKQWFFSYLRVENADLAQLHDQRLSTYQGNQIPEPANSFALLWREAWDLDQTSLMMGMRIGRNGFELIR